ncbi:MAG: hypothetical protein K0B11_02865 [Mariniphaga sp.]|nr:hypothetical protein [Mariniphaga sp.]
MDNFILESNENGTKKFFNAQVKKLSEDLVVATYSDITLETLAAKEMKINTRRMERAEKLSSFGSWEIDLNTKIIYGTKGSSEIYGMNQCSLPWDEIKKIAQIGNWKFDPENRNLKWSDQVLQILEKDIIPVSPVIEDFKHFTGKKHFKLFKDGIQSAINKGKPFEHQFQINNGIGISKTKSRRKRQTQIAFFG